MQKIWSSIQTIEYIYRKLIFPRGDVILSHGSLSNGCETHLVFVWEEQYGNINSLFREHSNRTYFLYASTNKLNRRREKWMWAFSTQTKIWNRRVQRQLLFFPMFLFSTFQEAQEPICRRFWMPRKPVLKVHINQTKTLGITILPLVVVQQWPCKVPSHICAIPVKKFHKKECLYILTFILKLTIYLDIYVQKRWIAAAGSPTLACMHIQNKAYISIHIFMF